MYDDNDYVSNREIERLAYNDSNGYGLSAYDKGRLEYEKEEIAKRKAENDAYINSLHSTSGSYGGSVNYRDSSDCSGSSIDYYAELRKQEYESDLKKNNRNYKICLFYYVIAIGVMLYFYLKYGMFEWTSVLLLCIHFIVTYTFKKIGLLSSWVFVVIVFIAGAEILNFLMYS